MQKTQNEIETKNQRFKSKQTEKLIIVSNINKYNVNIFAPTI